MDTDFCAALKEKHNLEAQLCLAPFRSKDLEENYLFMAYSSAPSLWKKMWRWPPPEMINAICFLWAFFFLPTQVLVFTQNVYIVN